MISPRLSLSFVAVGLIFVIGCGGGGRMAIQGKVSVAGTSLSEGRIAFAPTDGKGPQATGMIKDGSYSIPAAEGPMPGNCRVEVYSKRKTGKKIPTPGDPGTTIDEEKEMIPAEFNVSSKLTVTFESGKATYDFDLKK